MKPFSLSSVCNDNERHNITLEHDIYGEDDANEQPPVFVCHGLFGNRKNWRGHARQMNRLTSQRVVSYDAVNHGDSSHNPQMSFHNMSDDLIALMDRLHVQRGTLVGHSMGGKTVMTTALTHPHRISKLVVVDSAPELSKSMGEIMGYLSLMKDIDMRAVDSVKAVDAILEKSIPSKSLRGFLLTNLRKQADGSFDWRIDLDAIEENYHYIHSFPHFDATAVYEGPTLFIGGARSYYITEAEHESIFRFFPNASIQHVPDAGHWVHSEKPKEFLDILIPFLKM